MTDYDNTNTGALFRNDKDGNEKRPDYTGTINVNGEEFRLAAWIREAKSGKKYMSLRVSEQQERQATAPQAAPQYEDKMPF